MAVIIKPNIAMTVNTQVNVKLAESLSQENLLVKDIALQNVETFQELTTIMMVLGLK